MKKKFKPDILIDVLELDYTKLPIPDFIWASTPCNTFSPLVWCNKNPSRDNITYKALNESGRLGDKLLKKTIEIIKYFLKKNPKLKWVIENPRGMMRHQPIMKNYDISTTTYCMYGDKRYKPTDFFNNFNLELKPCCIPSNPHTKNPKHILIGDISLTERYKIPPRLINDIFNQSGI